MNTLPYISISKRIRANAPEIKHIDLYNAQYENSEKEDPFNTPAVFIEYLDGNWDDMTSGIQQHVSGFILHVVSDTYDRTANIDLKTEEKQLELLEHLTIDSKVHSAVKGFVPDGCHASMHRIYTDHDTNHDQIMIVKHTYACVIADETALDGVNETDVNEVSANGSIVTEIDFGD
jgi:hypothetical protein